MTQPPPQPKPQLAPNPGKSCCTSLDGETWTRIPVHTDVFTQHTPLEREVARHVAISASAAYAADFARFDLPWFAVVSEKVVAITQGRSYPVDSIRASWTARVLSSLVVKTPHGIGLGHPATMQLAIDEAGLPRILAAAAASAVGKAVGRRGWFYRVAGHGVDQIDGPTPNSLPPSDTSAKAPVLDPCRVARHLSVAVRDRLEAFDSHAGRQLAARFVGVVILDASDLGCQPLGWEMPYYARRACELFADNPLGQDRQQTPIAVVVRTRGPVGQVGVSGHEFQDEPLPPDVVFDDQVRQGDRVERLSDPLWRGHVQATGRHLDDGRPACLVMQEDPQGPLNRWGIDHHPPRLVAVEELRVIGRGV